MKKRLNCVMLIDDDEPTNFLNQMVIEESGFVDSVKVFQSGKQALGYLSECIHRQDPEHFPRPDLIFLDINMPAMNGWEFLNYYTIYSKISYSAPKLVMLTTSLNPDDKKRAGNNSSVVGYRSKPLTEEVLREIISDWFPEIMEN